MLLYEEGQARASARKTEAALLVFRTLINSYPRSEYALKIKASASVLEGREKKE